MKREYSKPTIHVEIMSLDMPIARSCDSYNDYYDMQTQGWFISGLNSNCQLLMDGDTSNVIFGNDNTICYHAHVTTTLTS